MTDKPTSHPDYITVALLGSGYAAIHMRWDADMQGYDVQQTGVGRYVNRKAAIIEAGSWARSEDIEFRNPDITDGKLTPDRLVRATHRSDQDQRGRMTPEDLETIRPIMDAFERATPIEQHNNDTWNEAIEVAAKRIESLDDWFPVAEIRKLKR